MSGWFAHRAGKVHAAITAGGDLQRGVGRHRPGGTSIGLVDRPIRTGVDRRLAEVHRGVLDGDHAAERREHGRMVVAAAGAGPGPLGEAVDLLPRRGWRSGVELRRVAEPPWPCDRLTGVDGEEAIRRYVERIVATAVASAAGVTAADGDLVRIGKCNVGTVPGARELALEDNVAAPEHHRTGRLEAVAVDVHVAGLINETADVVAVAHHRVARRRGSRRGDRSPRVVQVGDVGAVLVVDGAPGDDPAGRRSNREPTVETVDRGRHTGSPRAGRVEVVTRAATRRQVGRRPRRTTGSFREGTPPRRP